jgi:hypothetical protein
MIKMKYQKSLLVLIATLFALSGCKKDKTTTEQPFVATEYFIAGTITPKSGSYASVYFIKIMENNKAVFMGSGNDFTGDYTLTKDSLIVTISDPNNYRIAKFAINDQHQLTQAYYRALTTEYNATGELIKIEDTNQLAGKSFKGEEFKMGSVSFRKDLIYKFGATGTTYGSSLDASAINDKANTYELINNSAFKYKSGSNVELGFVANKKLTVFRLSGLYYYGKYEQQ